MRKLILALLICLISGQASATVYLSDNFDGYADSPENHGWSLPSRFTVVSSDSPDGGRAIMATVLTSGTVYGSGIDPNPSGVFNDGYIGFWVKFVNQSPATAGGNKFLKLFSADYPTTYSNVTFAQDYTSGQFGQISHGNGESTVNDSQQVFRYNGTKSSGAVGTITDYSASFYLTDGTIRLTVGNGTAAYTSEQLSNDTTYHIWVAYTAGPIGNGSVSLYAGTGLTRPASPLATATNAAAVDGAVRFIIDTGGVTATVDQILVDGSSFSEVCE